MVVVLNTCNYKRCLPFAEEVPGVGREFGEINNHNVREDSKKAGNYAFNLAGNC
jgi:hypothetical protein